MLSEKKILIVEDDPDIREALQDTLELEGYPVKTAANGQEAIHTIENGETPQMIILDLMMPVMNGWQFLEKRKTDAILSQVPVVVVSAAGSRLKEVEADGVLSKPIEFSQLLEKIRHFYGTTQQIPAEVQ